MQNESHYVCFFVFVFVGLFYLFVFISLTLIVLYIKAFNKG